MKLNVIALSSADATTTAEFVPEAGMLCCSLVHGGEQLLDPGKGVAAYATHGATMGIPLLYPWANRLDGFEYRAAGKAVALPDDRARIHVDPSHLPIHGAIPGLMRWEPAPSADGTALEARLAWTSAEPKLLELFPFAHEARLEVTVAPGAVTITTTIRPNGEDRVPVSFGYHPYLRVPGAGRETWRVQLPELERLKLDERMIPTGERETVTQTEVELANSSWDDGFVVAAQPARFAVSAPSGRGIALELLEGYPFAQIYAPPGHDYICLEPMTAPTNALGSGEGLSVVEPGGEYRAAFRVTPID